MTLPRFRIRTLMIVAAGFAVLFALESQRRSHQRQLALQRQAAVYTQNAAQHALESKRFRAERAMNLALAYAARRRGKPAETETLFEKARRCGDLYQFHDNLKKKYEMAAASPERTLNADPPEPSGP